jgi:hypothetical protein
MTAPNLVNVQTITGKTAVQAATVSVVSMLGNLTNSSQLYKVNYLLASNTTTSAQQITVYLVRSATNYSLITQASVPANSSLVVWGKDTAVYLEEGDTISIQSNGSSVVCTASYEILA